MKTAIRAQTVRQWREKTWGRREEIGDLVNLVVDWVTIKRKDVERTDGYEEWIDGVNRGDGGQIECVIRGREGLHWRTPSTQPECMLGTVLHYGPNKHKLLPPSHLNNRWKRDEKMRGNRERERERIQWRENLPHYFIVEKGVFLFRFVWKMCSCMSMYVRRLR